MGFEAGLTAFITCASILLLSFTRIAPDAVFLSAVGILLLAGVLEPAEALIGFTNEGLATVTVLYIIARGIKDTGLIGAVSQWLLGRPKTIANAQVRLMAPVAAASALVSNTPVVAVLIPAVTDWAKRNNLDVSQLMMPLSFAAIIGGTCTLIGTSTNLIVNGMILEIDTLRGFGIFELAMLGVPCTIMVIAATILLSKWLLPRTGAEIRQFEDARRYTVAMQVMTECPLIGLSVEDAGLRGLAGMYLVEITRGTKIIPAVAPEEVLEDGDILLFAGIVESVVDLQKIIGLVPATNQVSKVRAPAFERLLAEVVVSHKCSNVGKSIRDGRFRSHYNAAVIAVARDGENLNQKIGDIVLRAGDMLLLDTHADFAEQQRYRPDFMLVNNIQGSEPVRFEHRHYAGLILAGMVAIVAMGLLSMLKAAILAAGLMIITRCTTITSARKSVDLQVVLTIGAAIGLAYALDKTGIVKLVADSFMVLGQGHPYLTLATVFLVTALLTAVVSNAATAVILFPTVLGIADQFGVDPTAFIIALMFGASASFATPIGYQTNLMVYGPGGYHFRDFLKIGLPITALVGLMVVVLAPIIWPF